MTDEDRKLLETTARAVLALREDVTARLGGIEMILQAIFETEGDTALALAKLKVRADLLALKGMPSAHLSTFVGKAAAKRRD